MSDVKTAKKAVLVELRDWLKIATDKIAATDRRLKEEKRGLPMLTRAIAELDLKVELSEPAV